MEIYVYRASVKGLTVLNHSKFTLRIRFRPSVNRPLLWTYYPEILSPIYLRYSITGSIPFIRFSKTSASYNHGVTLEIHMSQLKAH